MSIDDVTKLCAALIQPWQWVAKLQNHREQRNSDIYYLRKAMEALHAAEDTLAAMIKAEEESLFTGLPGEAPKRTFRTFFTTPIRLQAISEADAKRISEELESAVFRIVGHRLPLSIPQALES